jgi:hypothetical protein
MNYGPVMQAITAAQEKLDEQKPHTAGVLATIALARATLELAKVNEQVGLVIQRSNNFR